MRWGPWCKALAGDQEAQRPKVQQTLVFDVCVKHGSGTPPTQAATWRRILETLGMEASGPGKATLLCLSRRKGQTKKASNHSKDQRHQRERSACAAGVLGSACSGHG